MNVLVCGAGVITRELVRRLGDEWNLTIVDTSEHALHKLETHFPDSFQSIKGDCSSPVVLEEAKLSGQDYFLALTPDDKVNQVSCTFAKNAGVMHILALVNDPTLVDSYNSQGIRPIAASSTVARSLFNYLQDPKVSIIPLTSGKGEVVEITVEQNHWIAGVRVNTLSNEDWRIAALFRDGEFMLTSHTTTIESGDRLVVVGKQDIFGDVCNLFSCEAPHFPLAYGTALVLLDPQDTDDAQRIRSETYFLSQSIHVRKIIEVTARAEHSESPFSSESWPQQFETKYVLEEEDSLQSLKDVCTEESVGLAVMMAPELSFWDAVTKIPIITLAHSLPCPLLISRNTAPYKKLLVPFNSTARAELALSAAIDLAQQFRGEVTVVIVEEPDFIQGEREESQTEHAFRRIRELSHAHKFAVQEEVLTGNPVTQIVDLADNFDLLVIGSTTKDRGLFSPHIGEQISQKSPCSTLILTS